MCDRPDGLDPARPDLLEARVCMCGVSLAGHGHRAGLADVIEVVGADDRGMPLGVREREPQGVRYSGGMRESRGGGCVTGRTGVGVGRGEDDRVHQRDTRQKHQYAQGAEIPERPGRARRTGDAAKGGVGAARPGLLAHAAHSRGSVAYTP
ncbi:hypothetical protein NWFMUON74_10900 [Nocardia wallacei]|uniref:Uncharacterized protein n=1 Tax=Nocardia wallacei TaxID=480035 RepID=A0A7G1KE32_9NOCA|nr:hypothetical protein NWFMUON74_10900 [Nocardia wallacei]